MNGMIQPASSTHRPVGLLLVFVGFVAMSLWANWSIPIFEAPDEVWHFEYIRLLASGAGLPDQRVVGDRKHIFGQGTNPPLYYAVGAGLLKVIDPSPIAAITRFPADFVNPTEDMTALADDPMCLPRVKLGSERQRNRFLHSDHPAIRTLHWLRLWSTACGVLTLFGVIGFLRETLPHHPEVRLIGLAVVAFNPMFIAQSGVLNSDNLVTALSTIGLWRLAAGVRAGGFSVGAVFGLGIIVGLGLLAKQSISFLPLTCLAGLFWVRRSWRSFIEHVLLFAGTILVIAGWFYLRNALLYGAGDILGWKLRIQQEPVFLLRPDERWEFLTRQFLPILFRTYWGSFGCIGDVTLPTPWCLGYALVTVIGLIGFGSRTTTGGPIWIGRLAVVLNVASVIALNWVFVGHQGRYLYPSLAGQSLLIGLGSIALTTGMPMPRRRQLAIGGAIILAGLAAGGMWILKLAFT